MSGLVKIGIYKQAVLSQSNEKSSVRNISSQIFSDGCHFLRLHLLRLIKDFNEISLYITKLVCRKQHYWHSNLPYIKNSSLANPYPVRRPNVESVHLSSVFAVVYKNKLHVNNDRSASCKNFKTASANTSVVYHYPEIPVIFVRMKTLNNSVSAKRKFFEINKASWKRVGNRNMQIRRSAPLFSAKSVDPPKFLFKSETTITSENRGVKVQR